MYYTVSVVVKYSLINATYFDNFCSLKIAQFEGNLFSYRICKVIFALV